MTSPYISHEYKTKNGTINIPDACILIIALVDGSIDAPVINGVSMSTIAQCKETGAASAVSIHQYKPQVSNSSLVLPFVFAGNYVDFVYLSGGIGVRNSGTVFGYNSAGSFSANMSTSANDFVLGILSGIAGPTALQGDAIDFTYLVNTATQKAGYIIPGDATLTCLAQDTGTTPGGTKNGKYHPPVLIQTEYYTFEPVYHPAYYSNEVTYENGVRVVTKIFHPASTAYPGVKHEAVYSQGYYDVITIPPGTGQVNAAFVSITLSAEGDDAVSPVIFQ